MTSRLKTWIAAALWLAAGCAAAADLPSSLSGRWSLRTFNQKFALDDIQDKGDGTFAAKLTWWTKDSKCALRSVPVTGQITDKGIRWNATTACKVPFEAELVRGDGGWEGTAKSTNPAVEMALTAK